MLQCVRRRARPDRSDGRQRRRHPRGAPALRARSGRYFYPDQYSNDANWRAHYDTTGVGDPRTDRRTADAFRRRPRHERHVRRHRRAASATAGRPIELVSCSRSRRCTGSKGSSTWRRRIVPAIYDPSLADRRSDGRDRGRARDDARAWRARRDSSSGRRAARRSRRALEVARTHRTRRDRHDLPGRRRSLPRRSRSGRRPARTLRLPVRDARGDPRARRRRPIPTSAAASLLGPKRRRGHARPGALDNSTDRSSAAGAF